MSELEVCSECGTTKFPCSVHFECEMVGPNCRPKKPRIGMKVGDQDVIAINHDTGEIDLGSLAEGATDGETDEGGEGVA